MGKAMITGFELTDAGTARWGAWFEATAREDVDLQATTLEMLRKVEEHLVAGEALVYELGGRYTLTGRPELFELADGEIEISTEPADE